MWHCNTALAVLGSVCPATDCGAPARRSPCGRA